MKSKKTSRTPARPRRRERESDVAAFTVVLEDLRAQFAVFGEALQEKASRTELHAVRDELRGEMHEVRDELRGEMHEMRDELRGEMHAMRDELRAALLDISRRLPS